MKKVYMLSQEELDDLRRSANALVALAEQLNHTSSLPMQEKYNIRQGIHIHAIGLASSLNSVEE